MLEEEEFEHLLISVESKGTTNKKHFAVFDEDEYRDAKGSPLKIEIQDMFLFFK